MTSDLTAMERRIVITKLEADIERCHGWDCARCRQLREIIAKLEGGDSE